MSRARFVEAIQEATGATQAQSKQAAADVIDAIIYDLKHGGSFTLVGFGTFTVRRTKARKGRNPYTQETIKIRAGKTVRFKASRTLKGKV